MISEREQKRKLHVSRTDLCWLLLFSAGLALMLWKCPYGFGGSDESFYLTVPHRLCLGQKLFSDEWHLSQLSSFFLYPFVALYRGLHGSNEGILLASRYLYVLMHGTTSFLCYLLLRRQYGFFAALATVLYLLYTPFNMMNCSYNTIAIDMLLLAGVLMGACNEHSRLSMIGGGAAFACAVVCCPYLAVAYLLYALTVPLFGSRRLASRRGDGLFTPKAFFAFTGGILIPFLLFLLFFLRHTDLPGMLRALPGIFSDPEHPGYSLWFMVKHYVYCIVTAHGLILLPLGLYGLSLLLLLADKKRVTHRALHLGLSCLCAILCFALFYQELTVEYYNAVAFPLAMPGFSAYLLLQKKPVKLFCSVYLLGLVYSACVSATSNMGFDVIAMAYAVVNVGSLLFIGCALREMREETVFTRGGMLCPVLAILTAFAMVIGAKVGHCFWDASPTALHTRISSGPARGIVTSRLLAESYENIYNDMQSYREKPHQPLLVMSQIPWCYLIAEDYPYGSFSAWLSGLDNTTVERLELYYQLNPAMLPSYIYIVKDNGFGPLFLQREDILKGAQAHGYSVTENEVSYKLERTASAIQ